MKKVPFCSLKTSIKRGANSVPRRIEGERIGRLTGRNSKRATRGTFFDTRFHPSQPHLQRKKATARRRAVFTSTTFTHRARWGHPPTSTRHVDGRDTLLRRGNAVHAARYDGGRRGTPARCRRPCPSYTTTRYRGGALDARPNAGRTTLRRKRRPAGTCTSASSSSSAEGDHR